MEILIYCYLISSLLIATILCCYYPINHFIHRTFFTDYISKSLSFGPWWIQIISNIYIPAVIIGTIAGVFLHLFAVIILWSLVFFTVIRSK